MTGKFTPGEWRAEITRVYLPDGKMMWIEGGDFDTQIANAALIAAAPELYYCVCDALTDLEMSEGMRNYFESVLKKARGEE